MWERDRAQRHTRAIDMRLLVVSNRLPFTASSQEGELVFRPSPGGLVSGLTAYLNWARKDASSIDHLWIGWPGIEVDEKSHDKLRQKAAKEQAYPGTRPS